MGEFLAQRLAPFDARRHGLGAADAGGVLRQLDAVIVNLQLLFPGLGVVEDRMGLRTDDDGALFLGRIEPGDGDAPR